MTLVTEKDEELSDLFYQSVSLSDQLNGCMKECRQLLLDKAFYKEKDLCGDVIDNVGFVKVERVEEERVVSEDESSSTEEDSSLREEDGGEEQVLTETATVSSTVSESSEGSTAETVELELSGFKKKRVVRVSSVELEKRRVDRVKRGKKDLEKKTACYIAEIEKRVHCKSCRSVMGEITRQMRECESTVNAAKVKPYEPATRVITNVQEAVAYQIQYEREWYSAVTIQRAWRHYFARQMVRQRKRADRINRNAMRLKYGHIAGFVKQRDARKCNRVLNYGY